MEVSGQINAPAVLLGVGGVGRGSSTHGLGERSRPQSRSGSCSIEIALLLMPGIEPIFSVIQPVA